MQDPRTENKRRYHTRLRAEKARVLEVERMSSGALWMFVTRATSRTLENLENWNTREAFYELVRIQQCQDELYLRGEQLRLFSMAAASRKSKKVPADGDVSQLSQWGTGDEGNNLSCLED